MYISVVFVAVAASAPPATVAPLKVAAPGLSVVQAAPELGEFVNNHLAQALTARGLEVTSASDMAAVIGHERQKQLLGCADADASCFTELANALGVDALLMGDLAKLGGRLQLNVRLIDAQSGKRVAAFSGSAASEEALVPTLERAADALAQQFAAAHGRTFVPRVQSTPSSPVKWIVGGVGGALVLAGGVGLWGAQGKLAEIQQHPATLREAQELKSQGQTFEALGWTGIGLGAAAIGTAVVLHLVGGNEGGSDLNASFVISNGGGAVAFGGTW